MADSKDMSVAKRAYEERRAKKAGKSLDAWMNQKQKRDAPAAPAAPPPKPKKPGLIARLLDRAHKPL